MPPIVNSTNRYPAFCRADATRAARGSRAATTVATLQIVPPDTPEG
jgi:hypothetical protein